MPFSLLTIHISFNDLANVLGSSFCFHAPEDHINARPFKKSEAERLSGGRSGTWSHVIGQWCSSHIPKTRVNLTPNASQHFQDAFHRLLLLDPTSLGLGLKGAASSLHFIHSKDIGLTGQFLIIIHRNCTGLSKCVTAPDFAIAQNDDGKAFQLDSVSRCY